MHKNPTAFEKNYDCLSYLSNTVIGKVTIYYKNPGYIPFGKKLIINILREKFLHGPELEPELLAFCANMLTITLLNPCASSNQELLSCLNLIDIH